MTRDWSNTPDSWFGIGPRIGAPALLLGLLLAFPCWRWRASVRIPLPSVVLVGVGGAMVVLGMAVYVWSLRCLRRGRGRGELVTDGPYAWSRHPIYAAWTLLLLPGIGLLSGMWPLLLPAVLAYVQFRRHVGTEEASLREFFGERYAEYAKRTSRLVGRPSPSYRTDSQSTTGRPR